MSFSRRAGHTHEVGPREGMTYRSEPPLSAEGGPAQFTDAGLVALRKPEIILKSKVAVIYGAGGAVGGAVARAFAREGG
jgi:hypothetical protein